MQFQYNSDYPETIAKDPLDFPMARPLSCARIRTRIYHPKKNVVEMVDNVLVKSRARTRTSLFVDSDENDNNNNSNNASSPMEQDNDSNDYRDANMSGSNLSSSSSDFSQLDDDENDNQEARRPPDVAYLIQRTIRDAIYGRVLLATVLEKNNTRNDNNNADWIVSEQLCAVKEMSWQHIRQHRDSLAEDPIKEVSCMQYLKERYTINSTNDISDADLMIRTNVMMPLDLLSDERHLYSIMPFCNNGELFEVLEMNDKFTEPEARYWMKQILNGVETLQHAGICHRDMSLENLLVHESGALIIDMGMCLRIPFAPDQSTTSLAPSQPNSSVIMNGDTHPFPSQSSQPPTTITATSAAAVGEIAETTPSSGTFASARSLARYLIRPQGTCGKWVYMSPEIYKNSHPFDGFTVDMWAAGVILFLMLTGFPPWDRACQSDERFRYMSGGYLVPMLTEWEIGLSPDAMDLLQRMLFLDPKDRLSLDQVRAHPWMINGPCEPPSSRTNQEADDVKDAEIDQDEEFAEVE